MRLRVQRLPVPVMLTAAAAIAVIMCREQTAGLWLGVTGIAALMDITGILILMALVWAGALSRHLVIIRLVLRLFPILHGGIILTALTRTRLVAIQTR